LQIIRSTGKRGSAAVPIANVLTLPTVFKFRATATPPGDVPVPVAAKPKGNVTPPSSEKYPFASTFPDCGALLANGVFVPKSCAETIVVGSSSAVVTPHSSVDGPSLHAFVKRTFGSAMVPVSSMNDLSWICVPLSVPKRTTVVVVCESRLTLGSVATGVLVHDVPAVIASMR
jgi:hypothetical protein